MDSPFRIGDYVNILASNDKGYITYVDKTNSTLKVKRVIDNCVLSLSFKDCNTTSIMGDAQQRSSINRHFLSAPPPNQTTMSLPPPPSSTSPLFRLKLCLKQCKQWAMQKENKHPLLIHLKQNHSKGKGWLRSILPQSIKQNKDTKTMTNGEHKLLLTMLSSFFGIHGNYV